MATFLSDGLLDVVLWSTHDLHHQPWSWLSSFTSYFILFLFPLKLSLFSLSPLFFQKDSSYLPYLLITSQQLIPRFPDFLQLCCGFLKPTKTSHSSQSKNILQTLPLIHSIDSNFLEFAYWWKKSHFSCDHLYLIYIQIQRDEETGFKPVSLQCDVLPHLDYRVLGAAWWEGWLTSEHHSQPPLPLSLTISLPTCLEPNVSLG